MNGSNPTKLTPITTEEEFSTATSSLAQGALLILYFHAPWAAPCAQMSTVLETLASTYPQEDPVTIRFLSIDAEELPDISEDHDVTAVPYVIVKRDGTTLDSISGPDAARVRSAVEKHYGVVHGKAGAAQLPPAQQVTRPEQQPIPQPGEDTKGTAADSTLPKNGGNLGKATTFGAYNPDKKEGEANGQSEANAKSDVEEQDLQTRLTQLVKAAPVMLFMKGTPSAPQCGFSRQLVGILREQSVRYGFFNILADEEVRQGLKEFADWPTFPQLWLQGELVGGLDIVREEVENDADFFKPYAVDANKKVNADTKAEPPAVAA